MLLTQRQQRNKVRVLSTADLRGALPEAKRVEQHHRFQPIQSGAIILLKGGVAPLMQVDDQHDNGNRKTLHESDPFPEPVRDDSRIGNQLILQIDDAASGSVLIGEDTDMIGPSLALLDSGVFKGDTTGRDLKASQLEKGGRVIAHEPLDRDVDKIVAGRFVRFHDIPYPAYPSDSIIPW